MGNLRHALKRKRQRETFYDIVIDDPTEAEERVTAAQSALRLAGLRDDDEAKVAAQAELDEARAALSACVHRVVFHNLPADAFEDLIGAHPPQKDKKDTDTWDARTFRPALIAACAVDSDMTEQEWAEELASERWNEADVDAIFMAALSANVTPRSVTVPKG